MSERVIDTIARAEAVLDGQDDVQQRLEADIGLAETFDAAISAATAHAGGIGDGRSEIAMAAYIAELAAAQDDDLRAVAALLREEYAREGSAHVSRDDFLACVDRLTMKLELVRIGVLDAAAFSGNLRAEVARHQRTGDPLALFVVRFDDELGLKEELGLVRALREIAVNAGEMIGRTAPGSYALLIPWIEPERAQALLGTLDALVRGALPNHRPALGLSAAVPERGVGRRSFPWPMPVPPEGMEAVRRRSR